MESPRPPGPLRPASPAAAAERSETRAKQQLVITLDEATSVRYLAEAAKRTQAEVDADCMPSGASLRIDLCPPSYLLYPVSMEIGSQWVEIGEADVELKAVE